MQPLATSYLVFVDFENVPKVDLGLVEGKPVHVTLLIGRHQKKLDVSLVLQIQKVHGQVRLVEVGASGRNALDLTLAYYLGQAVQETPGAHYCIVSKDRDFEPMIGHLRAENVNVARYDSFVALPFLTPQKEPPVALKMPPHESRRAKVIARLKNPATSNRPSSRKALLARIKTDLGKNATDADGEDLLVELIEESALTIDPRGKVTYP
jgi:hypothetical protein